MQKTGRFAETEKHKEIRTTASENWSSGRSSSQPSTWPTWEGVARNPPFGFNEPPVFVHASRTCDLAPLSNIETTRKSYSACPGALDRWSIDPHSTSTRVIVYFSLANYKSGSVCSKGRLSSRVTLSRSGFTQSERGGGYEKLRNSSCYR